MPIIEIITIMRLQYKITFLSMCHLIISILKICRAKIEDQTIDGTNADNKQLKRIFHKFVRGLSKFNKVARTLVAVEYVSEVHNGVKEKSEC